MTARSSLNDSTATIRVEDAAEAGAVGTAAPVNPELCGERLSWGETCALPVGHSGSHGIPLGQFQ